MRSNVCCICDICSICSVCYICYICYICRICYVGTDWWRQLHGSFGSAAELGGWAAYLDSVYGLETLEYPFYLDNLHFFYGNLLPNWVRDGLQLVRQVNEGVGHRCCDVRKTSRLRAGLRTGARVGRLVYSVVYLCGRLAAGSDQMYTIRRPDVCTIGRRQWLRRTTAGSRTCARAVHGG